MSPLPFFGKKKGRNRYSERKSVSLTAQPIRTVNRGNARNAAGSGRGVQSLLGFFSAATLVTVCVVLFLVVAVGLIFVYRWSTSSDYFALRDIDVHGLNNLSYTEVLNQAEVQTGLNSLALSLDNVENRLLKNPWVAEVSVKRSLPDGLVIKIKEREPSYWTLKDGHMHYADKNGLLIAEVNSSKFLALPILEVAPDSVNIAKNLESTIPKLTDALAALPADYPTPALYRLTQARGMEVHFENKPLRLLFGFENIEENIRHMGLVLGDLKNRGELAAAREIRAHNGKVWVVFNGT